MNTVKFESKGTVVMVAHRSLWGFERKTLAPTSFPRDKEATFAKYHTSAKEMKSTL